MIVSLVASIVFMITFAVATYAWYDYSSCKGNKRLRKEDYIILDLVTRCGSCYEDEKTCISTFQSGARLQFYLFIGLFVLTTMEMTANSLGIRIYHQENGGGCCSCCKRQ